MSSVEEVKKLLLNFVNSCDPGQTVLLNKDQAAIIVATLARQESLLGAVSPGQSVADIKQHLRTLKEDKADGSRESSAG